MQRKKESAMDYRIVWVHGIEPTGPGYTSIWDKVYNQYLQLPTFDYYIEVFWADMLRSRVSDDNQGMNRMAMPLATQQQLLEDQVLKALTTVLLARSTAQAQNPALVGEWSQLVKKVASGQIELPPWVLNPASYIGEFVKYLVSREIRNAVKEEMKKQLRLLPSNECNCSIIAHSWGTVVVYESLLDLEKEMPYIQIAHLFTLGSPLWLVHYLLDDPTGHKPRNVANWVNIHAQDDVIGAGLTPVFQVDADFSVANFDYGDPHGSYFATGNVAVERDIIAATILG
jgi:hypothetical protein